jgi:Chlorophyll A-B binding protein
MTAILPSALNLRLLTNYSSHSNIYFILNLSVLLLLCGLLELTNGAAIFDQAKGSGRASGDFSFDPLNLGKDPKKKERYAVSEIKNGRLAMLAISGILTQQAAFPDQAFPFF